MTFGEEPGSGCSVEGPGKILATCLDLCWLHNWERNTPVEETMRTLADLVGSGKARHIGFFNVPAWGTAQGADDGPAEPVDAVDRVAGRVLVAGTDRGGRDRAESIGTVLMPWSPLKNGFLKREVELALPGIRQRA